MVRSISVSGYRQKFSSGKQMIWLSILVRAWSSSHLTAAEFIRIPEDIQQYLRAYIT